MSLNSYQVSNGRYCREFTFEIGYEFFKIRFFFESRGETHRASPDFRLSPGLVYGFSVLLGKVQKHRAAGSIDAGSAAPMKE